MKTIFTFVFMFLAVAAVAAAPKSAPAPTAQKQQPPRPNIIYIMVEDMPCDMLPHSERYPFLDLPNLARLQREGATFTNFFTVLPLSSPSRATNLTGVYPHVHGVTQNVNFLEPDWERTKPFSLFLHQAGYTTAFIGKIHMASDAAHQGKGSIRPGFDYWVSLYGSGAYDDPLVADNGREVKSTGYVTDILSQYAIDWLEKGRDRTKPFMMCLWHKAVNNPFTPAPRHEKQYADVQIAAPPYGTDQDDLSGRPKYLRARLSGDMVTYPQRYEPKPWMPQRPQQMGQLRGLSAVDQSLGRILEALQRQGILDNTVMIFSSDNGYMHGEHQRTEKRVAYENSIRIPMIVRYPPLVPAASTVDEICLNLDVAPTILDLASVPMPEQFQGASFKGLMAQDGSVDKWRKAFLYEYFYDNAMRSSLLPDLVGVRGQRYKYIYNTYQGGNDIDELYDLQNDPGEMHNLFIEAASARTLANMRTVLENMKTRYRYNPDRNWRVRQIDPAFKDNVGNRN